jgi:beta-lactamase class A
VIGPGLAAFLVMGLTALDAPSGPLERPTVVAPAPREVSFGRVSGTVSPGTDRIVVAVDGKRVAAKRAAGPHFSFAVRLPARDVAVRVTAVGLDGKRASTTVRPVFGLPAAARRTALVGVEDRVLARRARALARGFPGTTAVFVQDLETGAGASWNALARFPGASTLKLPIAVEVLRVLGRRPAKGSRLDRLLRDMLVHSDNEAANALETWLGGSVTGGAAKVNATLDALGLRRSHIYGGFLAAARGRPIPLRLDSQPQFGVEKHTTAWDLARLHRYVHLGAGGRGPLVDDLRGNFTAADARFLLFTLAHSADHGKIDRFIRRPGLAVAHKAGWIEHARHDSGLVYWPGGGFVVVVMTWSESGVGTSADVLAGRVAQAALERFRPARRAASVDAAAVQLLLESATAYHAAEWRPPSL